MELGKRDRAAAGRDSGRTVASALVSARTVRTREYLSRYSAVGVRRPQCSSTVYVDHAGPRRGHRPPSLSSSPNQTAYDRGPVAAHPVKLDRNLTPPGAQIQSHGVFDRVSFGDDGDDSLDVGGMDERLQAAGDRTGYLRRPLSGLCHHAAVPEVDHRRAVNLTREDGASVAQIAKDLGISESSAQVDEHRRCRCRPQRRPEHHRTHGAGPVSSR